MEGKNEELGKKQILKLVKEIDDSFTLPERNVDKPFKMSVEGTFNISGRGTVVTGTIDQGKIKSGKDIHIYGYSNEPTQATITGIETFKKKLDWGEAGDNVGILLRGLKREDVQRGQVLAEMNSLEQHQCIEAQIYFLTEEEGGRKKGFQSGFKPQVFINTADISTSIKLPEGTELGMPGDNLTLQMRFRTKMPIEKN